MQAKLNDDLKDNTLGLNFPAFVSLHQVEKRIRVIRKRGLAQAFVHLH